MPSYKITAPDGATYNVTAPDDATQDEVLARVQQQHTAPSPKPADASQSPASNALSPHFGATTPGRFLQGMIVNPVIAGGQMLVNAVPGIADMVGAHGYANDVRGKAAQMNAGIKQYFDEYERDRAGPPTMSGLVTGQRPDPGFDFAQLAGGVASPINRLVPLSGTLPAIATKAGAQGVISGLLSPTTQTENFAGAKGSQAVVGGLSGAIGGVLGSKFVDALSGVVSRVRGNVAGLNPDDLITQAASASGVDLSQVPRSMLDAVRKQTADALSSGRTFDAAAALRQVEGNMVIPQAPLTLGQATRQPQQFANEQNLRGVTDTGNPLAARFAGQNNGLIEAINRAGAAKAPGEFATGNVILDTLRAADATAQRGVSGLYSAARGMNGGEIPLDHRSFADTALGNLDRSMKGAFLPAEVRSIVNDISSGKTPLNVTVAEQLKTILGNASAGAKDGNTRAAVGIVRSALDDARPLVNDGGVLDAFGAARAAARDRFAKLDATPSMKAAVDGAPADDFFRRYVINGKAGELQSMMDAVGTNGTKDTVRDQVVAYLKSRALNGASDEVGSFSQSAYNKALSAIGDEKLATMFAPEEIETLKRIGRVASYVQKAPAGSAVNTSNTGAAALNLLSGLAGHASNLPLVNVATKSFRDYMQSRAVDNALLAKLKPEAIEGASNPLAALLRPATGAFAMLSAQALR